MLKNDRSRTEINQRLKFMTGILGTEDNNSVSEQYSEIFKLLDEGSVNDGENLLFDYLEEGGPEVLKAAIAFYDRLNVYSDRELEAMNFSRREIKSGLDDIMDAYGLKWS